MAHSYTPGLTVTEQAVVRRRRMLSLPGSVLVTTGETVRANQAVARAELPGKVYPMNLANQLGVAPDEIHEYLIKKAGDPVQKDEILAENKPLIKWLKTEVLSPITGAGAVARATARAGVVGLCRRAHCRSDSAARRRG